MLFIKILIIECLIIQCVIAWSMLKIYLNGVKFNPFMWACSVQTILVIAVLIRYFMLVQGGRI